MMIFQPDNSLGYENNMIKPFHYGFQKLVKSKPHYPVKEQNQSTSNMHLVVVHIYYFAELEECTRRMTVGNLKVPQCILWHSRL